MPLQGSLTERNLYLTLTGSPAVGVLPAAVLCEYRKSGGVFTTKTLDGSSWVDLGGGYYILKFSPAEMDTLGEFVYRLTSTAFDNFKNEQFEIEPVPENLIVPPPDICVVTGNLRNIRGEVPINCRVTAYPVEFTAKYGQNIVNADKVVTYPDLTTGQFQLSLVRGSVVIVQIDRTGIRNQITVPDSPTANLVDLLVPFPIDIIV